jgi:hypothetical protein
MTGLREEESQRGLAGPTVLGEPELRTGQRRHVEMAGDGLARGQPDGLAALQVTVGQRRVVAPWFRARDLGGQRDQRAGVVPGGGSTRLLEERVLSRLVLAQAVDQPVVQLVGS